MAKELSNTPYEDQKLAEGLGKRQSDPIRGSTVIPEVGSEILNPQDEANIGYINARTRTEQRKATFWSVFKYVVGLGFPALLVIIIFYLANITSPVAVAINEVKNLKEVSEEINFSLDNLLDEVKALSTEIKNLIISVNKN